MVGVDADVVHDRHRRHCRRHPFSSLSSSSLQPRPFSTQAMFFFLCLPLSFFLSFFVAVIWFRELPKFSLFPPFLSTVSPGLANKKKEEENLLRRLPGPRFPVQSELVLRDLQKTKKRKTKRCKRFQSPAALRNTCECCWRHNTLRYQDQTAGLLMSSAHVMAHAARALRPLDDEAVAEISDAAGSPWRPAPRQPVLEDIVGSMGGKRNLKSVYKSAQEAVAGTKMLGPLRWRWRCWVGPGGLGPGGRVCWRWRCWVGHRALFQKADFANKHPNSKQTTTHSPYQKTPFKHHQPGRSVAILAQAISIIRFHSGHFRCTADIFGPQRTL